MFHRREAFRKSGKMIFCRCHCIDQRVGRQGVGREHCLKRKKGHFFHCTISTSPPRENHFQILLLSLFLNWGTSAPLLNQLTYHIDKLTRLLLNTWLTPSSCNSFPHFPTIIASSSFPCLYLFFSSECNQYHYFHFPLSLGGLCFSGVLLHALDKEEGEQIRGNTWGCLRPVKKPYIGWREMPDYLHWAFVYPEPWCELQQDDQNGTGPLGMTQSGKSSAVEHYFRSTDFRAASSMLCDQRL